MHLRAIPWPDHTTEANSLADLTHEWRLVARQQLIVLPRPGHDRHYRRRMTIEWQWLGSLATTERLAFLRLVTRGEIATVQRRDGPEILLYARRVQSQVEKRGNETLASHAIRHKASST